jgi:hypothetical protein
VGRLSVGIPKVVMDELLLHTAEGDATESETETRRNKMRDFTEKFISGYRAHVF